MNRDRVIAYLLHQMPEPERLAFAERWMSDPALHDELRTMEDELLDAYVRDEVSETQRPLIERYLLTSPTQREKLAFAAALRDALPAKPQRRRLAWSLLAAAAVAVITSGAAIWLAMDNAALRRQAPPEAARPVAGSVLSFFLPASAVRGPGAEDRVITLSSETDVLQLDLEIEPADAQGSYTATVSQSGSIVWRGEPIYPTKRGDTTIATLWIPTRPLAAGRYEVALKAGTSDIAYHELRISR